ncbi:MAG: hypothetical protein E7388_04720 [Ruminococcaceae bacterium]|nr:hypothetical protein [Oscillospiraceae bacterium]
MSLFKINYDKEGPGIEKDEPQKRAFFRYIEMLWAKRFKILQGNLLYFGFNLIVLLITLVLMYFMFSLAVTMRGMDFNEWGAQDLNIDTFYRIVLTFAFMCTSVPIFALGPVRAGLNFLSKSYVKGEPVFTWTDFSTKMRSNRKLGLKVGLINGLVGFFLLLDAVVYLLIAGADTGIYANIPWFIMFIAAIFIIFAAALFAMMNLFIYPMMVTFNITIKQLYKNAFIFAMIRWLPNMLILLADFLIIALPLWLIPGTLSFYVTVALYIFITPALIDFTNTFYAYPLIKKFMIDNPVADKSEKKETKQEFPEFVPTPGMQRFVNGRYLDDEEYAEYLKHTEIMDLDDQTEEDNKNE